MNSVELLISTGRLLGRSYHWTKEAYARDPNYNPVDIFDSRATLFSIVGAISFVQQDRDENSTRAQARSYIDLAIIELFPERAVVPEHDIKSIPWFNDHEDTKYQDVIAVLRLAVRTARQHQLFLGNIRTDDFKKSLFKDRQITPQDHARLLGQLKLSN